MERRAAAEAEAAAAHDPTGPGGWVEERDITGGPATGFVERSRWPETEAVPGDLVLEGPEAGPVFAVHAAPPEGDSLPEAPSPHDDPGAPGGPALGSRWLLPFAQTLQQTRLWMRDVGLALGSSDPRAAWHALHAVLPVLRDQLTVEEVADLSAELPVLLRGLFVEGWSGRPQRAADRAALLAAVERRLGPRATTDPEQAVRAVMHVLGARVTRGEMADVLAVLPKALAELVRPG